MSFHFIEEKVEDALASVIISQTGGALSGNSISGGSLDGFFLYKGFSLEEMDFPALLVTAVSTRPNEPRIDAASGNQMVTVRVQVMGHKGDATTTRSAHAAVAGAVRDVLYIDDDVELGTGLSVLMNAAGVADLTVMKTFPSASTRGVQGGLIVTETSVDVKCYPN